MTFSFQPSSPAVEPAHFPRGSFTMNRFGRVVVSTLPQQFSKEKMDAIGRLVIAALADAAALETPLTELTIQYAGLEISARNLAGGAMIFLNPREF